VERRALSPRAWLAAREALFVGTFVAALAYAGTAQGRVDVGAVPLINYTSDEGAGLGANAALFFRDPAIRPYRYALALSIFFTTRSIQDHMLRFDAPFFLGSQYRPTFMVRFERDPVRPYYGIGNDTRIDKSLAPSARDALYEHTFVQPQSALTLKRTLGEGWELATTLLGALTRIEADASTLLFQQKPTGYTGGFLTELAAEVAYDSRDSEAAPTRGVYAELVARGGQQAGNAFYAGGALVARGYVSPWGTPALTLAARFDLDVLAGDVPFTRLGTFAGRPPVAGIGGSQSLRGIPRYLYIGKVKTLGNFEARSRVHRFCPGDHTLDLMLAGFVDTGRVWTGSGAVGPWRLHGAAGGGLRVGWEEDYVIRLDYARAFEGSSGLYLDFSQAF
jgi:outer membrane protein assembly factor BamA